MKHALRPGQHAHSGGLDVHPSGHRAASDWLSMVGGEMNQETEGLAEQEAVWLELNLSFDAPSENTVAEFLKGFITLAATTGGSNPRFRLVKNPIFDSFGNLWE